MKLEIKHIAPYLPYNLKCRLGGSIEEIKGINYLLGSWCVGFKGGGQMWDELTSIKPLLKPLSELSGEDISKMTFAPQFYDWEDVRDDLKDESITLEFFNYLVSKHYDVFGLIDNGLAEVKG